MKSLVSIALLLLSVLPAWGQSPNIWTACWNRDSTLIGYKDKDGTVKIEPKFVPVLMTASSFNHIIPVTEEEDGKWKSYYLTKDGKEAGRDSMYVFDTAFDCESEGFIRFRDRLTDRVGMFDRNGNVAIPALYDDASRVTNGMFVGLKNAEKVYWDQSQSGACGHFSRVGGEEMLMDTLNRVLIENFPLDEKLDLFSLEITARPHPDSIRVSFPAKNGGYYSFIDFEKEFREWFFGSLLPDVTADKLLLASSDSITWQTTGGRDRTAAHLFIKDNYEILKKGLSEIGHPHCDYSLFMDELGHSALSSKEYEKYFDECGKFKSWIYPVIDVVVTHNRGTNLSQDHYGFLRTDNGYKLISVVIR